MIVVLTAKRPVHASPQKAISYQLSCGGSFTAELEYGVVYWPTFRARGPQRRVEHAPADKAVARATGGKANQSRWVPAYGQKT